METNRPDYTETLTRHGIRPTAVRLLIYKTALRFHDTFSMSELEDALESVDKSTVFRTLLLFAARHLLHEIEDGSGSTKYCICRNDRPLRHRRTALPFPLRGLPQKPSVWTTRISPPYAIPPASRYGRSTTCSKVCAPDCRAKRHV